MINSTGRPVVADAAPVHAAADADDTPPRAATRSSASLIIPCSARATLRRAAKRAFWSIVKHTIWLRLHRCSEMFAMLPMMVLHRCAPSRAYE